VSLLLVVVMLGFDRRRRSLLHEFVSAGRTDGRDEARAVAVDVGVFEGACGPGSSRIVSHACDRADIERCDKSKGSLRDLMIHS
jgi:hypothetical protein